ncbi:NfeD family protein [Marinicrinis lubricantis]|uniref:Nodulation protein NfeD n=1 Tax=Marinicrinis lubricantis TaxID=2086470 RepID=A0ABW1IUQ0_9BACL
MQSLWFRRTMLLLFMICMTVGGTLHAQADEPTSPNDLVYVIPIEQSIESGLHSFLERAVQEAEDARAQHIIFTVDTLGGRIDKAMEIADMISALDIPTTMFVEGKAISAGSYISLHADEIIMAPGSTIGDAAVVNGSSGERVTDSKTVSFWKAEMSSAAELNGRNKTYAEGMVDDQMVVDIPEIGKTFGKNQLVTFTAEQAVKAGYAEGTARNLDEVLEQIGHSQSGIIHVEPTFFEELARFVSSSVITTLLLIIGIAGIAIEMLVPGFGFPGILGIVSFGIYFFGHYIAGFAGMENVFLFFLGIALLIAEVFIPSFGILGTLGTVSLIIGVVMAAADTGSALISLGIAFVIAVIIVAIVAKIFKHRGVWNRFILKEQLNQDEAFTQKQSELMNQIGEALTHLRPAGTMLLEGGRRVDVVTSGEYIQKGSRIQVIKVEGSRVVVQQIASPHQDS